MGLSKDNFVLQACRLLSDFQHLSSESFLKDTIVFCQDGHKVKINSLLLASISPIFRNSLNEMNICSLSLSIPDISSTDLNEFFNAIIDWNYFHRPRNLQFLINICQILDVQIEGFLKKSSRLCCGKNFSSDKLYRRHVRSFHSPFSLNECSICHHKCRSKSELIIHFRIHTKEKPFSCTSCFKKFAQKSQLNDHINNVHDKLKFCHICGLKFESRVSVLQHVKVHDESQIPKSSYEKEENEIESTETTVNITQRATDSAIQEIVINHKPHMCSLCGKTFSVSSNLKKHSQIHEKDTYYEYNNPYNALESELTNILYESSQDEQICEFCGKIFDNFSTFSIHSKIHTKQNMKCKSCSLNFENVNAYKVHMKNHVSGKLVCLLCDRKCISKSSLDKHMLIHSGEKPHECDSCHKKFTQRSHLNYHVKTVHLSSSPYQKTHSCSKCDKKFPSSSALSKHFKVHTNERNYKCNVCDKAFIQNSHRKTHMLKHTGIKPFSCIVCSKSFITKSNLKEHCKVHSNDKMVYKCKVCPAQYSSISDLRIHHRKHSGETPFNCSYCSKAFRSKRNLNDHLRIHTGEKPFVCTNCSKGFSSAAGLRQHLSRYENCKYNAKSSGVYSIKKEIDEATIEENDVVSPHFPSSTIHPFKNITKL